MIGLLLEAAGAAGCVQAGVLRIAQSDTARRNSELMEIAQAELWRLEIGPALRCAGSGGVGGTRPWIARAS